ncbi:MAG: cytochrome c [Paracoccaceae bacterium]|jgi:cytochrome c
MKNIFAALIIAVIAVTVTAPVRVHAGGAAPPNLDAGQTLAESRCAHCHATGRVGASPLSAAPPFRHLGRKWPVENMAEALAEGIVVGHPAMPTFAFSPPEIDDFLGWLEAIQEK